jgi:hypothetical protein
MTGEIKKAASIIALFLITGLIFGCVEKPSKEEIETISEFRPPEIPPPEPIEKEVEPPEEGPAMPSISCLGKCMGIPCLGNPSLNSLCCSTCCPVDITPCLSGICKLLPI